MVRTLDTGERIQRAVDADPESGAHTDCDVERFAEDTREHFSLVASSPI
ncbi:MAG: hypothetical protein Q8S13_12350 [Dehalococcoidia bacterium]|nr:hypothetical protein [Dehalococcoidia bacterium]